MKTLVLESFFNKIAELKPCNETPIGVFSCEYCKIFKNTFLQNAYGGCFCETIKFYKDICCFFPRRLTSYASEKHNRNIFHLLKCTSTNIFKLMF